ncbi:MAG TPA: adenosine-specific kinase [Candidatus Binataceae bacterium]|nr:adenosine-specific kinase [Candidatus Binataceae bacterium]
MELKLIKIAKPNADINVIIGQSHFIKTVEDLYEAMVQAVPGIKFGAAFNEASGPRLIRHTGTDTELEAAAVAAAQAIAAGHVFVVMLGNAFPINVLNSIKSITEVCQVFCATANPLTLVVAEHEEGRGVLGVLDGGSPLGVEAPAQREGRHAMLRRFGYKQ